MVPPNVNYRVQQQNQVTLSANCKTMSILQTMLIRALFWPVWFSWTFGYQIRS